MQQFLFLFLISLCISFDPNKSILKVFVIEINPILKTITNKDLYKNNGGHPYVSEYFSHRMDRALEELKEDIKFASHGQITVEVVQHSILDEFPKYTKKVKLLNDKSDYSFDEATYVSISKSNEKDKGDWFKLIYDPLFDQPETSFTFDYEYLIQKYDLVTKRNKNVFDHVWILGIDPLGTYETMMVGSGAFWINGSPIQKECPHFMITGFTISRRDSNLHALAHSLEDLINYPHKGSYFTIDEKVFVDETQEAYEKLSYWEKFTLIDKLSKNQNAGVGYVHYPFNGASDYDYDNTKKVYSNWENWLKYPNIKTTTKNKYNNDAWMTLAGNAQLLKDSEENQDSDRLYIRFWMYLFPHIDGYTEDGFLNNWWGYFTNLDYVTSIDAKNKNITGYIGKEIELNYDVYYKSGEIENEKYIKKDKNVQISGNCVEFSNNKLIGAKKERCSVSIYRDGKNVTFSINVLDSPNIYFRKFLE